MSPCSYIVVIVWIQGSRNWTDFVQLFTKPVSKGKIDVRAYFYKILKNNPNPANNLNFFQRLLLNTQAEGLLYGHHLKKSGL